MTDRPNPNTDNDCNEPQLPQGISNSNMQVQHLSNYSKQIELGKAADQFSKVTSTTENDSRNNLTLSANSNLSPNQIEASRSNVSSGLKSVKSNELNFSCNNQPNKDSADNLNIHSLSPSRNANFKCKRTKKYSFLTNTSKKQAIEGET